MDCPAALPPSRALAVCQHDHMGLLDRLARTRSANSGSGGGSNYSGPQIGEAPLAGTTTTCRDAVQALMTRHGVSGSGMLGVSGVLQPERDNPVDADAIAVHVEGERIGYLTMGTEDDIDIEAGSIPVQVRLFSADTPRGWRVEAWVWLAGGDPRWTYDSANRPPMSSAEKNMAMQAQRREMVASAIAGGGQRAEQFKAGMVDGIHYLELVEPIKQLKRENRLEEALVLAYKAVEAAENSAAFEGWNTPAPFYTEQAAIILRKLGRRDEEIQVLRRWMDHAEPKNRTGSITDRLAKLEGT